MSKAFNVSLKVTFTKIWPSQDFDFLSLKNLTPGLGANVCVIFVLKKLWRLKIKEFLLIGNWVKLWRVGAKERKKKTFLVPFTLSEGKVFNICVLSIGIVHWGHFQISASASRHWHQHRHSNTELNLLYIFAKHVTVNKDIIKNMFW